MAEQRDQIYDDKFPHDDSHVESSDPRSMLTDFHIVVYCVGI